MNIRINKKIAKSKIFEYSLVAIFFIFLTAIMTLPWILHFNNSLPGYGVDNILHLWNVWWFKRSLTETFSNPFFTDFVFYPLGTNLIFHTLTPWNGFAGMIFQLVFKPIASLNLVIFLSFILTGLGTYALSKYLLHNRIAAFFSAFIFTYASYRLMRFSVGHFELVATQWIPFYTLFLLKSLRSRKVIYPLFAGIFLCLTGYTSDYYLVFLGLLTLIFILYLFIWERDSLRRFWKKSLVVLFGTFILGFAPVLFLLARSIINGSFISMTNSGGSSQFSADILGYIIPNILHPLLGNFASWASGKFTGGPGEYTVYVGIMALALAIAGFVTQLKRFKELKLWLICLGSFFILSLGPALHIAGYITIIPLPFKLLQALPIINHLRAPTRFSVMVVFIIALAAGYGVYYILNNIKGSKIRIVLLTLIFSLCVFDSAVWPVPLRQVSVPQIYYKIAQEKEDFTILELPLGFVDGTRADGETYFQSEIMYYQTIHHKRLLGGYVSRLAENTFKYFENQPLTKTLMYLQAGVDSAIAEDEIKKSIEELKIKYVIIHSIRIRNAGFEKISSFWDNLPFAKNISESDGLIVYEVD